MGRQVLYFLIGAAYLAGLFALVRWGVRRAGRMLARRTEGVQTSLTGLGGRVVATRKPLAQWGTPEVETELPDGSRVCVASWYVSRDFTRLNLRVPTPSLPVIVLTREGRIARFSKHLGITREVQLGDPLFDDKVFIHSAEPDEKVSSMLRSPAMRERVVRALDAGFSVSMGPRGLELFHIALAWKAPSLPLSDAAAMACGIAGALPDVPGPVVTEAPRVPFPRIAFAAMGLGVLAAFSGATAAMLEHGATTLLEPGPDALLAGLALSATLVAVLIALARGRSNSHRIVLGGGAVIVVFGTFFGSVSALWLNEALDDATPESMTLAVLEVHTSGKAHDLHVKSWRPGRNEEYLNGARALLNRYKAGDSVDVRVHGGALGWRWAEIVPPPAP